MRSPVATLVAVLAVVTALGVVPTAAVASPQSQSGPGFQCDDRSPPVVRPMTVQNAIAEYNSGQLSAGTTMDIIAAYNAKGDYPDSQVVSHIDVEITNDRPRPTNVTITVQCATNTGTGVVNRTTLTVDDKREFRIWTRGQDGTYRVVAEAPNATMDAVSYEPEETIPINDTEVNPGDSYVGVWVRNDVNASVCDEALPCVY